MKRAISFLAVAALLSGMPVAFAVPPAYTGQFGNPEEPALRVVKWPVLGLRKLFVRTHEGLHDGIHKSPCAAVCEGSCGAVRGTGTLIDHTARGMVYAPLPPKAPLRSTETYEDQALAFIEKMTAPPEEPEEVVEKEEEEKEAPYLPFRVRETGVERAQQRYVPDRAAQRERTQPGTGNLLRLAR